MIILRRLLFVILLLPVLLVLVSLFLPSRYRVERSLAMKARPETIFALINTPRSWPEWTVWTVARFRDMKVSFSGPDAGVGAAYAWEGKSSGNGLLKITSSDSTNGIAYDLEFERRYFAKGSISLQPSADSVRVTWVNTGELGWNPVSRFFGVFFVDKRMGPDLEVGLWNLKRKVEAASGESLRQPSGSL